MTNKWTSDLTIRVSGNPDHFKPYPHQTAAWDAMTKHFEKHSEGMLVVPTGGGKTAIAARWLLRRHVRNGGRVLWLAHRQSLLRQAASSFFGAASEALPRETLSRIVVSSQDSSWRQVSTEHDLVFASIQSTALTDNIGFLDLMKSQSKNGLFVVVDEAHHAAAPSYQRVLQKLMDLGCPVLGLSATPVRLQEADEKRLWNLFRHIVYQVSKQSLINQGILSTPHVETVQTQIEFERDFTEADTKHLERFGELGAQVLARIAKHSHRNQLIVQHYKANAAKYGKTIVFAVDTLHAQTLAHEFGEQGVSADYVDYTRGGTDDVIAAFRDESSPTILANVEMLTEGVDIPATKSVFIVRPTRSEALLSQMVGRALRGPQAGGTEDAHLVTFVDTWKHFNVLDAEYVVQAGEVEAAVTPERIPVVLVPIERQLVLETYKLVRSNARGDFTGVFECLPHKWFVWEAEYNDDIQTRHLMVFENQTEGFTRLLADFAEPSRIPEVISEDRARALVMEYFGTCQDPLPSWIDVMELLNARRRSVAVNEYTFEEKRRFQPSAIAKSIWERDLGERAKLAELQKTFEEDPVCQLVYRGDVNAFREDVQRELDRMGGVSAPVPPEVVEKVPRTPRPWPEGAKGHELSLIFQAVVGHPGHFPKGVPTVKDIAYMEKPSHTHYGFFRYSDCVVRINPALNSPEVPRFVMEYLVYHEVLHADMPSAGHDRNFRDRERRFTPTDDAVAEARERGFVPPDTLEGWRLLGDQFLDTLRLPKATKRGEM